MLMIRHPAFVRKPRRVPVVVIAAGLFAVMFAAREAVTMPGIGITLLYDVPVALVAVVFGLPAGVAAATVGLALFAVGDMTEPIRAHGFAQPTGVTGYLTRAANFYVLAVLLGMYSDRVRRIGEQFRGLLESAPDATVIVNEDGDVVLANTQAEALSDLPTMNSWSSR